MGTAIRDGLLLPISTISTIAISLRAVPQCFLDNQQVLALFILTASMPLVHPRTVLGSLNALQAGR